MGVRYTRRVENLIIIITNKESMGLFSAFSSKSSAGAGSSSNLSSHHISNNTPGKISGLEIDKVHHDLVSKFGQTKGGCIFAGLKANMDKDHGFGSSGISASEVAETIHNMKTDPNDGIDKHTAAEVEDILDKRL